MVSYKHKNVIFLPPWRQEPRPCWCPFYGTGQGYQTGLLQRAFLLQELRSLLLVQHLEIRILNESFNSNTITYM